MAVLAPVMVCGLISPLQFIAAFVMLITGIFDRVRRVSALSFILMPVWSGVLILITASMGVVVGMKLNPSSNSGLAITYRALNVLCSILCGFILFSYGTALSISGHLAQVTEKEIDNDSFAVLAIIFVVALIEVFLCIMAILASQDRNSAYMQLVDPPVEPYNDQTEMRMPLSQVGGSNFATSGVMQQMPSTSGGRLMYVQVPDNHILSQENTFPQEPQATTYPSGAQFPV